MNEFKEIKYDFNPQSWHETSSGVGHQQRPGYYFPDTEFTTMLRNPLPPPLVVQDEVTRDEHYKTTANKFYDYKHPSVLYDGLIHKKAPGHWKVNFIKDLSEKLGSGKWRKPLTMSNEESEMKCEYKALSGLRDKYRFDQFFTPLDYKLQDHHKEGPTKYGESSTQNLNLKGQPFFIRDKEILKLLDPFISTTHKEHHSFKSVELNAYPKKNVPTYWECEQYPKAWGFGLKHNKLPVPTFPREKLPMRDSTKFMTATKLPRIPKSLVPVPHGGQVSEYTHHYTKQDHMRQKENYHCAVDTPSILPDPGSKSVYTAPKMYRTENEHIGGSQCVAV